MSTKNPLPSGRSAFNVLYHRYKRDARVRKDSIPFELTREDVSFITQMNCHYCGIEPKQVFRHPNCNGDYIYNGIDRIDSSKGYAMDNVVPCCKECNHAKWDMTRKEFLMWLERIYKHQHR